MPPYKKRNTSRNKETSADWQGLLYYSIVGVVLYIAFMALRSLTLGTNNKSSFADWLKSIFNIFESGNGSGDETPGSSSSNDNAGFETPTDTEGTGQDLYTGSIKDYTYFKASEYFGNYPRPSNPVYIANYDKLMRDLDLIRKNFGSAVKIVSGYKAGEIAIFQECKGAHIKAANGQNQALNNVVVALRKTSQIAGSSVFMEDSGETRYYIK